MLRKNRLFRRERIKVESISEVKHQAKEYCRKILNDNLNEIYEIVLIGSIINGGFNEQSDIDIVVVFNEELEISWDKAGAYLTPYNKTLSFVEKYGHEIAGYPVDIGFIDLSGNVYMGGGMVGKYREEYETAAKSNKGTKVS